MIQTTSLGTRAGTSLKNPNNPTNNHFNKCDDNVTNISGKIVRSSNELRQSLSKNRHFSEGQSETHEDMQLYKDIL